MYTITKDFSRLPEIITVILLSIMLSACGGGGGGDTAASGDQTQGLQSVTGAMVFKHNYPVIGAVVTVTDAVGTTREVITDTNGLYYVEVKDLKLPLLIVGTFTQSTGIVSKEYSFVSADKSTITTATANLNKYTSLLVAGMAMESGIVIQSVEALDDMSRNHILGVDYLAMLARMDEVFCSVFLNADGTPKGCEWGSGQNILTTSYVPNTIGTIIDKLNLVVFLNQILDGSGRFMISDGYTVYFSESPTEFFENTVSIQIDPADLATMIYLNTIVATKENTGVIAQLPTSNSVTGVIEYDGNFPMTQVFVDNLTACPIESRNFVVTPGENSEIPVVIFADYQLEIDVSPTIVPVVSRTTINPTDACRPYAFDYQFDYNMVIKKTQTGLVDGVPVWTYDVPACEQYSNKTLENILQESYQYTDVDFDLLLDQPNIEVHPALHRYTESWPNSSVNFVYDPTCPMVASFAVTPISGAIPLTVSVDASASVGPASYSWSTSDGQTATGLTSSFTFNAAGTHSITLTIANSDGSTEEVVTKTVTVDPLPVAGFSWSKGASLQINLNGSSSTGTGIASYQWSTSDGQTATGQTASFTFGAAGSYSVTLTITDRNGKTSIVTQSVMAEELSTDFTSINGWIDPGSSLCIDNGGAYDPDYASGVSTCDATFIESQTICQAIGARIPTISEAEALVTGCGAVLNSLDYNEPTRDAAYYACLRASDFTVKSYWTSTGTTYLPWNGLVTYNQLEDWQETTVRCK